PADAARRQPGVRGPSIEKDRRLLEGNGMRPGEANLVTGRCLLRVKKDIAVLLEDEGLISGAVALPSAVFDVRHVIPDGEIRKLLDEMAVVVLSHSRKGSVFRPIHRRSEERRVGKEWRAGGRTEAGTLGQS